LTWILGREKPPRAEKQIPMLLGQLEAVVGRTQEAGRYLQKALALGATDPHTLMDTAELYALLGRGNAAIAMIKKAHEAGY